MQKNLIYSLKLENYYLAANFSRNNNTGDGIGIFSRLDLQVKPINLSQFCDDKIFEICPIQFEVGIYSNIVLCIYRRPSGNFSKFLNALDSTLRSLHKQKTEFIICGDLTVNFLSDSNFKFELSLLLQSYNLCYVVDFPTRFNSINNSCRPDKCSATALDNIFIDVSRINSYKLNPLINGLSDHNGQYFILDNVFSTKVNGCSVIRESIITTESLSNFIEIIKQESWEGVFSLEDVNKSFNSFLNSFLIHFESCFPMQHTSLKAKNSSWLTKGILVSCKRKRSLYIFSIISKCLRLKIYYSRYCKILKKLSEKLHVIITIH
jgi:hypothetical protein